MSMNFENLEVVTKNRCAVCNDKLTAWEIGVCILCESDSE